MTQNSTCAFGARQVLSVKKMYKYPMHILTEDIVESKKYMGDFSF